MFLQVIPPNSGMKLGSILLLFLTNLEIFRKSFLDSSVSTYQIGADDSDYLELMVSGQQAHVPGAQDTLQDPSVAHTEKHYWKGTIVLLRNRIHTSICEFTRS